MDSVSDMLGLGTVLGGGGGSHGGGSHGGGYGHSGYGSGSGYGGGCQCGQFDLGRLLLLAGGAAAFLALYSAITATMRRRRMLPLRGNLEGVGEGLQAAVTGGDRDEQGLMTQDFFMGAVMTGESNTVLSEHQCTLCSGFFFCLFSAFC